MSTLEPFDGTVSPLVGVPASVTLTVHTTKIEVGNTGSASAYVVDIDGNPLEGETVSFHSSNDTVIDDESAVTNALGVAWVSLPALVAGSTALTATAGVFTTPVGITITVTAISVPAYDAIGALKIVITAEPLLMRMNRAQPRRFTDAEQRRRSPTDSSFSRVKNNSEKEIVWPNRELLKRSL